MVRDIRSFAASVGLNSIDNYVEGICKLEGKVGVFERAWSTFDWRWDWRSGVGKEAEGCRQSCQLAIRQLHGDSPQLQEPIRLQL